MTANILSSELSILVQESKRKNVDLRNAAEKSLEDLRALPATSEQQLALDLKRRPYFVTPFLIACGGRSTRCAASGVIGLQRLIISGGLANEKLKDALDALRDATSQNVDVQLKILQALPPLLQNYAPELRGELLCSALLVCSTLQSSKSGAVNNTAAATLQQLVVSVFDKVVGEDESSADTIPIGDVPTAEGDIKVRSAALDAYKVFNDICLLTDSQRPQFLSFHTLPQKFGLELIESVLANHSETFLSHPEQAHVLRTLVMPIIEKSVRQRLNFSTTVRSLRVFYTILRRHLEILIPECEVTLSALTSQLESGNAALWKRALCMEVFRGIYGEPGLIRKVYRLYDSDPERGNIVREQMASLVRLATEKPSVIGLGQQSTLPTGQSADRSGEQVAMEAGGLGGVIGGSVSTNEADHAGISVQWSSIRVPCIDQLDKTDPPSLPDSYIYSLVLVCINNLSEGLAKFVLPLTIPSDGRSRRQARGQTLIGHDGTPTPSTNSTSSVPAESRDSSKRRLARKAGIPINPLSLDQHPLFAEISASASLVETCWPAILAACSTFLHAALDNDYYHGLVRSFQKFAHVAGLLRLSTPRDAFLTTLAKVAIPAHVFSANTTPATPSNEIQSLFSNAKDLLSVDAIVNQPPPGSSDYNRQAHRDFGASSLSTRNLLCLRALLNLGIALGPTLGGAWSIILEVLQQADVIIYPPTRSQRQNNHSNARDDRPTDANESSSATFGSEVAAVETAAARLFDSTSDFPDDSFLEVVRALFRLTAAARTATDRRTQDGHPNANGSDSLLPSPKPHIRMSSISGVSNAAAAMIQDSDFAVKKLEYTAAVNISRLVGERPEANGWDLITGSLTAMACSQSVAPSDRLNASSAVNHIIVAAAVHIVSEAKETRAAVQQRLLAALNATINGLADSPKPNTGASRNSDLEVQRLTVEALTSILEQCGESIVAGWDLIFEIVTSVFDESDDDDGTQAKQSRAIRLSASTQQLPAAKSTKLVRAAFTSLQLICSDFLSALSNTCILMLLNTLFEFSFQDEDLNISLTAITFFWNVSDFLHNRDDSFSPNDQAFKVDDENALIEFTESEEDHVSTATLWMLLLLRLTAVTIDHRSEVRNGAIQTLLRIFDSYGDQLGPNAWRSCLQIIVFKIIRQNRARLVKLEQYDGPDRVEETRHWDDTTILVVNGISGLFGSYLDTLVRQATFTKAWQELVQYFEFVLGRQSLEVNAAIFTSVRKILEKIPVAATVGDTAMDLVWKLWSRDIPIESRDAADFKAHNQDALIAYVDAFQEIHRLTGAKLSEAKIKIALDVLHRCVIRSDGSTYSTDVERMTTLQSKVLKILPMIDAGIPGAASVVMRQISMFISLPFQSGSQSPRGRRLTFGALSMHAIQLQQTYILTHKDNDHIYKSSALRSALESLALPISLKYSFKLEPKTPKLWSHATSTVLVILRQVLPRLQDLSVEEDETQRIWTAIVKIASGIMSAKSDLPVDTPAELRADEDSDTASFAEISALIIPSLGSEIVSDKSRRSYTESLFSNSLLHEPGPFETSPPSSKEVLDGLYEVRMGRTYDPPAALRSRMCYVCLDELFALVAQRDGSSQRIRLAQAASPFLILRCAITLRGYIADQPLRGRMPQPKSQREELLYILRKLKALDCEPQAIPAAPGVLSEKKKHLHRLFPLISQAVRVAFRDVEVLEALGALMDVVAGEMGIL